MSQNFKIENHIFYSPAFKGIVTQSVDFFLGTPVHVVPPPVRFVGTGVYALYISEGEHIYRTFAELNRDQLVQPIYVGKAVPRGWRQGRVEDSGSTALYSRLREHSRSITQAENLELANFRCRFIVLSGDESNLIGAVEAELIRRYEPLWNSVIDGFGNHDPGKGRYQQAKSEWDTLHPGRVWAGRLRENRAPLDEILKKIDDYLMPLGTLRK